MMVDGVCLTGGFTPATPARTYADRSQMPMAEFHSQDDYRRDDRRDDRYDDRRPPGCNRRGSNCEWKLQQPSVFVF